MNDPAAKDREQLRKLVAIQERMEREGKATPRPLLEQISYHERRLAIIEGRG